MPSSPKLQSAPPDGYAGASGNGPAKIAADLAACRCVHLSGRPDAEPASPLALVQEQLVIAPVGSAVLTSTEAAEFFCWPNSRRLVNWVGDPRTLTVGTPALVPDDGDLRTGVLAALRGPDGVERDRVSFAIDYGGAARPAVSRTATGPAPAGRRRPRPPSAGARWPGSRSTR